MNIQEYLREHASYYFDQDLCCDNLDMKYILRFWNEKRKNFNFIRKKIPVKTMKPDNAIWREYTRTSNIYTTCFYRYHINEAEDYETIWSLLSDRSTVVNNKIEKKVKCGKRVFPQGTKLMKVLKAFAEKYNILEGFEKYRIYHSQIMNEKKLEGNLVISIHPLDYMTMSDNDNNWTSCMSWRDKGGYRAGTVEMMNSPYVVVAYLESNSKVYAGMPSKVWRKLFIVHPDIVCGIKGYPFESQELDDIVLRELSPAGFKETILFQNQNKAFTFNIESGEEVSFVSNYMYNDFWGHKTLTAYISPDFKDTEINYSGKMICVLCGEVLDDLENETQILCECCEELPRCSECGRVLDPEEASNYICEDCEYDDE